ncbi:MAG TPA: hypothetical protein VE170_17850, partial [Candidatus Limnocylindria bacterium]|nr:hypothetical protein [Candidatus Limnocylindria bacterium]
KRTAYSNRPLPLPAGRQPEVAEVTNIQEHYADVAQFAGQFDRLSKQLLGDLRRDVLTEDANRAIAPCVTNLRLGAGFV